MFVIAAGFLRDARTSVREFLILLFLFRARTIHTFKLPYAAALLRPVKTKKYLRVHCTLYRHICDVLSYRRRDAASFIFVSKCT